TSKARDGVNGRIGVGGTDAQFLIHRPVSAHGRLVLGDLLAGSLAGSADDSIDPDDHHEVLVVVGATLSHDLVFGDRLGGLLNQFLEEGFVVAELVGGGKLAGGF